MSSIEKAKALRIRTYVDPAPVLERKAKQIRRAIYICHGKDEAKSHYHVNVILINSRKPEEIRRWFTDEENPNAFCEYDSGTFESAICYYKHETEDAIAENKHRYTDDDICYFNCTPDDIADLESDDNSFAILRDIVAGVPLMSVAQKYGKSFVRYYCAYRALVADIRAVQAGVVDPETGEIRPR